MEIPTQFPAAGTAAAAAAAAAQGTKQNKQTNFIKGTGIHSYTSSIGP